MTTQAELAKKFGWDEEKKPAEKAEKTDKAPVKDTKKK
jgi:hypothetical protein